MGAFFARAWANPATTFGALVAVCALVGQDLVGPPQWVATTLKIIGGIAAIFAAAAARDSGTSGAASQAAGDKAGK